MSSILTGFEYDIFISYRQKDNKGDRWVSEFVEALKIELESTFKEEISVYFDINPHDGLLETHDVGESLKEKLKCLVLIPIISRTYCDPKSFAWEHEFKAFVDLASQDQFGLKVKLTGGNVASRVLPVCIHDLDPEDTKLCKSVLGGVMRGVEFIYKEPGVNKPLTIDDDEKKNLNGTKYRIQVNKVANAIKEIFRGLKSEPSEQGKERDQTKDLSTEPGEEVKSIEKDKPGKSARRRLTYILPFAAILLIAVSLLYQELFNRNSLEKLRSSGERISVAVMPFQNMTNDTIWNIWQDGIRDELINYLTNYEELEVRQTEESIKDLIQGKEADNYASITPSVASSISKKLDAKVFVNGSIKQAGTTLRINAQLIDSKTSEVIKPFQIEGPSKEEEIFHIIDSLSRMIKNFLIISDLKMDNIEFQDVTSTQSPEAYRYYLLGKNAYYKQENDAAITWLNQALAIDSNFTWTMRFIIAAYNNNGNFQKGKEWCIRWYEKIDRMPLKEKLWAYYQYSEYTQTPNEAIIYLRQIQELDDQNPPVYFSLGVSYIRLQQYGNAIPEFKKGLEIYKKWDSKPNNFGFYSLLGYAYHSTGQYKKEKKLYTIAEKDFPNNPDIISMQVLLSLYEGDTTGAKQYLKNYMSIQKAKSVSEAVILSQFGWIYSEAGKQNKAEEYFREALSLEPENPDLLNYLSWFLIDKDRNINEGMELIDKALKYNLNEYYYLDCKGWAYYKQGNYKAALKLLERAWELRLFYSHETYLHLEAAKKAVGNEIIHN